MPSTDQIHKSADNFCHLIYTDPTRKKIQFNLLFNLWSFASFFSTLDNRHAMWFVTWSKNMIETFSLIYRYRLVLINFTLARTAHAHVRVKYWLCAIERIGEWLSRSQSAQRVENWRNGHSKAEQAKNWTALAINYNWLHQHSRAVALLAMQTNRNWSTLFSILNLFRRGCNGETFERIPPNECNPKKLMHFLTTIFDFGIFALHKMRSSFLPVRQHHFVILGIRSDLFTFSCAPSQLFSSLYTRFSLFSGCEFRSFKRLRSFFLSLIFCITCAQNGSSIWHSKVFHVETF